eukprot:TRINITY_DN18061_c0_g1_i3.p2 TRINITY_DN18061_c0_g1~~TRINITY_DN18061_c0_g1_i3.p2  ORF type:complete len:165 (+),score=53.80 TRINITY_DN18061_c0_g1_i3:116-610(+)
MPVSTDELLALAGRPVEATCAGRTVRGLLHAVDPHTDALFILRQAAPGGIELTVCTGHGLREVRGVDLPDAELRQLTSAAARLARSVERGPAGEVGTDREAVERLLRERKLPFTCLDGGVLRVAGAVDLVPPYGPHTVQGKNEGMMRKLSALLAEVCAGATPPD